MRRKALATFGAVLLIAALALTTIGPGVVERRLNGLAAGTVPPPSAAALALHGRLVVADMHADPLLWGRDLRERASHGHVDVPRLIEGGVAVQGFSVVTKTPRNLNLQRNDDRTDDVTLLAILQRWPPRTWGSLKERALYQAARLQRMADGSEGRLTVLRTRADLGAYLQRRAAGHVQGTAGFLALEGAQSLEGDLASVDALFEAGYRMIAPVHFFDTEWGASAHGVSKGGLTEDGKALVRRLEEKGIVLDLAHASERTFADALAAARRPVVVSHTGVRGTCDNVRNLGDEQLRGIARTGGVVGIGYWDTAVCGNDLPAVVRAIRHAVSVAGADHVGLGSDFDGAVTVPFDTAALPSLTDALLRSGLGEDEVARVMGGNVVRVLSQSLP
jgi:microsomal dipeptidase-like Zn-dependent dipeptidase